MWAAVLRRSEECRKDWSASSAGTDLTVLVQTPTVLHANMKEYSGSVLSSLLTVRESCVRARAVCVEFAASPVFVQVFSQSRGFSCYQKHPQLTLLVLARHTPEKELYFLVKGTFTKKENPFLKESDRCFCMLLPLAPSAWSCQNMQDTKVKGRGGQQSQHHCGSHCAQN